MKRKRCVHCSKWRAVTQFYAHRGTADGLQSWCIPCKREAARVNRLLPRFQQPRRGAGRGRPHIYEYPEPPY